MNSKNQEMPDFHPETPDAVFDKRHARPTGDQQTQNASTALDSTEAANETDASNQTGDPPSHQPRKKKNRKKQEEDAPFSLKEEIFSWLQVLITAAVIAFCINTFLIANSQVPTGSMETTIMPGDRVIGSRLSYRFGDPERGDIAIFIYPDDEAKGIKTYYVKRIIGMPGDTIDIIDGQLYLNGSDTPLAEPYIREAMMPEEPMHYEVPEDSYFMMGDNRNYSNDSRRWSNTFVHKSKLVAKVLFQYFPKFQMLK